MPGSELCCGPEGPNIKDEETLLQTSTDLYRPLQTPFQRTQTRSCEDVVNYVRITLQRKQKNIQSAAELRTRHRAWESAI